MMRYIAIGCALAALVSAEPIAPQFDAASVKPVEWRGGSVVMDGDAGRIEYRQFGLKALIWVAFQCPLPQIVWPEWIADYKGDVFDISATFPVGTTQDQLPDAPASAPYEIRISKMVKYFNNGYLDRVMVDKTGLEGFYDINLFIPPEPDATTSNPGMQAYFDALEKQLGLKVESQTAGVDMLVIDHLEQNPTGN